MYELDIPNVNRPMSHTGIEYYFDFMNSIKCNDIKKGQRASHVAA